jgi:hypothetical protein
MRRTVIAVEVVARYYDVRLEVRRVDHFRDDIF